jgi:hypothetical protein
MEQDISGMKVLISLQTILTQKEGKLEFSFWLWGKGTCFLCPAASVVHPQEREQRGKQEAGEGQREILFLGLISRSLL